MATISSSTAYGVTSTYGSAATARSSISTLLQQLSAASTTTSSDTVTISLDALRALLQAQGSGERGGPPRLDDEQAASMGASIQEQDADLFAQLDTDADGVLSADEAEAGRDTVHEAVSSGRITLEKPEGAPPGQGLQQTSSDSDAVTISVDALKALLASVQEVGDVAQGPPRLSDEQAATMGAAIQEQDAELFTQLDTDEDGILSAAEAEAGTDAVHAAMDSGSISLPPPGGSGAGSAPAGGPPPSAGMGASASTSDDSDLSETVIQQIGILDGQGLSAAEIADLVGATEDEVRTVLQA